VESLAVDRGLVYLGGWFTHAGGQPRARLAAVDIGLAVATSWAPDADGPVETIALADTIVVAGGSFVHAGGAPHAGLVALSRKRSEAESWNLDTGGGVLTLAVSNGVIYPGGDFAHVGAEERIGTAAIDASTGQVLPWKADLNGVAWSSFARDRGVWMGGAFTTAGVLPSAGFASLDGPNRYPPGLQGPIALGASMPNPAQDVADVAYALQSDAVVSLVVYDVTGRKVSTVVPNVSQTAGVHRVSIRTAGWKPGCYYYRLEAAGLSRTRTMVVLR